MLSFFLLFSFPFSLTGPWGVGAYVLLVLLLLWAVQRRAYGAPRLSHVRRELGDTDASGASSGSVYVLSNPEHPGLVKIGYTTRDVPERVRELSSATGVPKPFEIEYEAVVSNPQAVETAAHQALDHRLVNPDREFFEVSVRTAIRTIQRVADVDEGRVGGRAGWVPTWVRAGLKTGLGGALLLGAACTAVALMIYSTPSGSSPASWTGTHSESAFHSGAASLLQSLLQYAPDRFPELMSTVGHTAGPDFLGYSGLLLVGTIGLWGYALARRHSLRPLGRPTLLAVTVAVAMAGAFGEMVHRRTEALSLWTSGNGAADAFRPWSGNMGTAVAGWLRPHLGSTGTLVLAGGLLLGSLLLGIRWALPATERGSS